MKSIVNRMTIETNNDVELQNITNIVKRLVKESKVKDGVVYVTTMHTTSGIVVNEGLTDVEDDLLDLLVRTTPEIGDYRHQRFLPSDGQMAVNSVAHQRSMLAGMQVCFPVENFEMVLGGRQEIYFAEFDGPLHRNYVVHVFGN